MGGKKDQKKNKAGGATEEDKKEEVDLSVDGETSSTSKSSKCLLFLSAND